MDHTSTCVQLLIYTDDAPASILSPTFHIPYATSARQREPIAYDLGRSLSAYLGLSTLR